MRFIYKSISADLIFSNGFIDLIFLDGYGDRGWELVGVFGEYALFKKAIEEGESVC